MIHSILTRYSTGIFCGLLICFGGSLYYLNNQNKLLKEECNQKDRLLAASLSVDSKFAQDKRDLLDHLDSIKRKFTPTDTIFVTHPQTTHTQQIRYVVTHDTIIRHDTIKSVIDGRMPCSCDGYIRHIKLLNDECVFMREMFSLNENVFRAVTGHYALEPKYEPFDYDTRKGERVMQIGALDMNKFLSVDIGAINKHKRYYDQYTDSISKGKFALRILGSNIRLERSKYVLDEKLEKIITRFNNRKKKAEARRNSRKTANPNN